MYMYMYMYIRRLYNSYTRCVTVYIPPSGDEDEVGDVVDVRLVLADPLALVCPEEPAGLRPRHSDGLRGHVGVDDGPRRQHLNVLGQVSVLVLLHGGGEYCIYSGTSDKGRSE